MAIHAFGAYYGLACAWFLFRSHEGTGSNHPKNKPGYIDDLTAMIGTIFLWIYWPSFNAATATSKSGASANELLRMYAIINTVLSLCGATLSAFAASSAFKGKLDMAVVQNATLAGGVAVGSAATMLVGGNTVLNVSPGGALGIGAFAGARTVHALPSGGVDSRQCLLGNCTCLCIIAHRLEAAQVFCSPALTQFRIS